MCMEPYVSCFYLTYCMEYVWKSVYFKELHSDQEYYWPRIYKAGAAGVSIITSDTNSICLSSQLVFHRWRKGHKLWQINGYCWFSHDATKIQTKELSILPRFYFHDALEQLKTNFYTNFRFKKVLGFVIEYAWIFKHLFDAPFTWRPKELSPRLKKLLVSGNFAI